MTRCAILRSVLVASGLITAAGAMADGTGQWQNGKEVYQKVCSYCHESGVGPVITGRQLPEAYIQLVVRHGYRAMPSFRSSEINDTALAELARLISETPAAAVQKVP